MKIPSSLPFFLSPSLLPTVCLSPRPVLCWAPFCGLTASGEWHSLLCGAERGPSSNSGPPKVEGTFAQVRCYSCISVSDVPLAGSCTCFAGVPYEAVTRQALHEAPCLRSAQPIRRPVRLAQFFGFFWFWGFFFRILGFELGRERPCKCYGRTPRKALTCFPSRRVQTPSAFHSLSVHTCWVCGSKHVSGLYCLLKGKT